MAANSLIDLDLPSFTDYAIDVQNPTTRAS